MTVQIISPHLDDAVLSLGQYMAISHPRVVTVFAGVPTGGLSDYDRSCGFESSATAMWERRLEDEKACAVFGAGPVHLGFLDRQYRPHWTAEETNDLADEIVGAMHLWNLESTPTFAPLGIGHPDHAIVARAVLEGFSDGDDLFLYEELPYRVLRPEEVAAALDSVRGLGFEVELYHPDAGARSAKVAGIECYGSQFPSGATDPCLLVPERAWRVTRT